jgi:SNF2 family DNA or RNA helicase
MLLTFNRLQALALISHTRPPLKHPLIKPKPGQVAEIGATLIVAPMSLITQWKEEAETKTDLKVVLHYGDQRMTEKQLLAASPDLVLSSYGTVASDFHNNKGVFNLKWFRVCLDEAHYVTFM